MRHEMQLILLWFWQLKLLKIIQVMIIWLIEFEWGCGKKDCGISWRIMI